MKIGEHIQLRVEVAHTLNVEFGTIAIVVQSADSARIAQKSHAIAFGSGKTVLETEFTVPKTSTIEVFIPLHIPGGGSSVVVDHRAYRVTP